MTPSGASHCVHAWRLQRFLQATFLCQHTVEGLTAMKKDIERFRFQGNETQVDARIFKALAQLIDTNQALIKAMKWNQS